MASAQAECALAQSADDGSVVYQWNEDGTLTEISVPVQEQDVQTAAMHLAAGHVVMPAFAQPLLLAAAIEAGLEGIANEEERAAALMASTETMLQLARELEAAGEREASSAVSDGAAAGGAATTGATAFELCLLL